MPKSKASYVALLFSFTFYTTFLENINNHEKSRSHPSSQPTLITKTLELISKVFVFSLI
ncbi:hypothetical protein bcgnr5378_36690 [Bacillus cereus]